MTARPPQSAEFIAEAKEHLAVVCDQLLRFERATGEALRSSLEAMLRAVHSVKGGAGFFGLRMIETLAHRMESLLELAMEGQVQRGGKLVDGLLAATDRIAALLDDSEHSNESDVREILARLDALSAPDDVDGAPGVTGAPGEMDRPAFADGTIEIEVDLSRFEAHGIAPLEVIERLERLGRIDQARVEPAAASLVTWTPETRAVLQVRLATAFAFDECVRQLDSALESSSAPVTPTSALPRVEAATETAAKTSSAPSIDRGGTIRVSVGLADQLMNLAGELVLVRNQSRRYSESNQTLPASVIQRFDAVTSAFQDTILQTRMQPVGNLFGKFPRLVRDLARQLGKQIELQIAGADVEIDKTILDAVSDPLTHLVRNACDHGIETSEERERAGKSPIGRIELSTRHYGDQIGITISDDGRGLDRQAIGRQAIKQGLRTETELAGLPDRELFALILLPGFSTAAQVSEVSGRGVGMDVVKTNLAQLDGTIEIESVAAQGSRFTLRLPLTLAIIPSLLVTAAGQRYAIPQKDLEELVCVDGAHTRARIERTPEQEVLRLRGRLLPLVRLSRLLKSLTAGRSGEGDAGPADEAPLVVAIVKAGARRYGLAVDRVLGNEEIVVKPMHRRLRGLKLFSSATILGDGCAALILSAQGVANAAGIRFGTHATARTEPTSAPVADTESVLLVRQSTGESLGVPVRQVRRIVLVRRAEFERLSAGWFVTIDGVPTQLLSLDNQDLGLVAAEWLFVLLPRSVCESIGFVIQEVLGTESVEWATLHPLPQDPRALGAAVLRGQITPIIDLRRRLERPTPRDVATPKTARPRILLVDDTKFFRDVVGAYLEAGGYEIVQAVDGAAALDVLKAGRFDLLVSDLEMPVMDGWTLAGTVRLNKEYADLPLLALTTLSVEQAEESALACGFDAFEVKLDRDSLIATVKRLLLRRRQAAPAGERQYG